MRERLTQALWSVILSTLILSIISEVAVRNRGQCDRSVTVSRFTAFVCEKYLPFPMSRNTLKSRRLAPLWSWMLGWDRPLPITSWESRGRWLVERLAWLLVVAMLLWHGFKAWSADSSPW